MPINKKSQCIPKRSIYTHSNLQCRSEKDKGSYLSEVKYVQV